MSRSPSVVMMVLVVVQRVMRMGMRSRGENRPLSSDHPQPDPYDQQPGDEGQIGFDARRHRAGGAQRGQHGHAHNAERVGERDEYAEDESVNGTTSRADNVGGGDRLAVARSGGVESTQPEPRKQIQNSVRHWRISGPLDTPTSAASAMEFARHAWTARAYRSFAESIGWGCPYGLVMLHEGHDLRAIGK